MKTHCNYYMLKFSVRKRNRNVKAKRRNTLDSGFWKLVSNNPQTLPKLYHTDRDFALQRNHIDTILLCCQCLISYVVIFLSIVDIELILPTLAVREFSYTSNNLSLRIVCMGLNSISVIIYIARKVCQKQFEKKVLLKEKRELQEHPNIIIKIKPPTTNLPKIQNRQIPIDLPKFKEKDNLKCPSYTKEIKEILILSISLLPIGQLIIPIGNTSYDL
mmetsp:Transcript_8031/g.7106  ORF Transcript_8031/g.7106 Transcript_8031/m.7106 type:complete len:217 (+) Transcript_8031:88-738(+)